MTSRALTTKKQLLCDAAERILRSRREPMHYTELAEAVYSLLGLGGEPASRLNGVLHDDGTGRFRRTGRGMWALAGAAEGIQGITAGFPSTSSI